MLEHLIESLRRGEKLGSAVEYTSLFWNQFDVGQCGNCQEVKIMAKTLKGKMTDGQRVLAKNVEIGKCSGRCWARAKKLQWLTALGSVKFAVLGRDERLNRREKFNKHWSLKGMSDGMPCFLCGSEAHHRHHLIQLQHGGINTQKNHVPLCRSCHTDVHKMI